MTRKSNPIPTYRKLKRKDRAPLAFVDLGGKRHYLGEHGTPESREAYHRLLAEWHANGGGRPSLPDEITVVEVAIRFLRWTEGYYVSRP